MKKLLTKRNLILLAVALVVVVGLVLALSLTGRADKIPLVLMVLAVVALLWLGVELLLRWLKQRRQSAFDEGVTAKEGIEDRRREWAAWTAELKKQGIDRYALPFYLLVGEPQSGKSILLQNSDLHFPFGQSRLSGVGGTRGCDWWFTEEAVILDLAGRLFTHEGGAADEVEWQAFLDLLGEFRPLCPANGIMLVIPCDALLSDSPEQTVQKCNRIQTALLTLSNKLQAQLPIYLVLTKADKIFGFAECVHRLDAAKRHEMFGWSRPAEQVDSPFRLDEVREAFEELRERARLLRAEMMGSALLPEAQGEVDRLFAFPEEIGALYPNLEVYLKRVFTESSLVDRLSFRGLYLTSGLQTGVPVAKVCGQLMGETGEADRRNLEAIFQKQRAYFIKDLIRKRIFAERGLVRPTSGRVQKAQRVSRIAYGAAAGLALASVAFATYTLLAPLPKGVYELAKKQAELLRDSPDLPALEMTRSLAALEAADDEAALATGQTDRAQKAFDRLYTALVDQRLAPRVRREAAEALTAELDTHPPASYAALMQRLDDAVFLWGEVELGDADDRARLAGLHPEGDVEAALEDPKTEQTFRLTIADALRHGERTLPEGSPDNGFASPAALAQAMREGLAGALATPGTWNPGGHLGFLLVDMDARALLVELRAAIDPTTGLKADVELLGETYTRLLAQRAALFAELDGVKAKEGTATLDLSAAQTELGSLGEAYERFAAVAELSAARAADWDRYKLLDEHLRAAKDGGSAGAGSASTKSLKAQDAAKAVGNLIAGDQNEVLLEDPSLFLSPEFKRLCASDWRGVDTPADLAQDLKALTVGWSRAAAVAEVAQLLAAKSRQLAGRLGQEYAALAPLRSRLVEDAAGSAAGAGPVSLELLQWLRGVRASLTALGASARDDQTIAFVDQRLLEYCEQVGQLRHADLPRATDAPAPLQREARAVLGELSTAVAEMGSAGAPLRDSVDLARTAILVGHERELLRHFELLSEAEGSKLHELIARMRVELEALQKDLDEATRRDLAHQDCMRAMLELVEARVDGFLAAGSAPWLVDQSDYDASDLAAAAKRMRAAISTSGFLQRASDSVRAAPGAESVRRELDLLLGLPCLQGEGLDLLDLKRKGLRVADLERASMESGGRSTRCADFASLLQGFERPEWSQDGGRLATVLKDHGASLAPQDEWSADDLASDVPLTARYVDDLLRVFVRLVAAQARQVYFGRLDAQVLDPAREAYRRAADVDSEVLGTYDELFRRDGTLDTLRTEFDWDAIRALLGAEAALARDEEAWQRDAFATALQEFLLGKARNLGDATLQVTVKRPDTDAPGYLWGRADEVSFFILSTQERDSAVTTTIAVWPKDPSIEWSFRSRSRGTHAAIRMVWSKARTDPESEGNVFEQPGPLAPLQLAWEPHCKGESDARSMDGGRVWAVRLCLDNGHRAPFDLQFDRPLPEKPSWW